MSNLRILKKRYNNSLSTYQFSKSLLNASVSTQEILNQKLDKAQEMLRICNLMYSGSACSPNLIVLCGPNDMFPGDFRKIIHEKGDLLLGRKVKGLEYSKNSLPCQFELCDFRYMDFTTNSFKSLNVRDLLKCYDVDKWDLCTYVDGNNKNIAYDVIWNYILTTIKYNEQKYRGVAINKFVNNCERHLNESRMMYYKARNAEITNQIIGFRVN